MSALMTNFDIARESVDIALGSEGSAEKEFENYQKGIDYSIGKLKASFQELSTATIDSGFVKGAVDGATALLNVLTQIVSVVGVIPTILSGVGIASFVKNLAPPKNHRGRTYFLSGVTAYQENDKMVS